IVKIKLLQSRIMLGVKNSAHRLILKFKDKSIQIYDISDRDDQDFSSKQQNVDFALKMLRLLTDMGGIIESHMIEVARRIVHPWETITFKTVLQAVPKVADYYVETHQQVAKRVCELVQSQDPIPKEVTVFSFGCGDGAELVLVNDKLRLSGISVKGFGFDINPENFKVTAALNKTLTFSKGDIHTLEDSIKAQTFDPNSLKIGLFIGVLTDTILNGTNEALKIIAQTRELDHLYVCGWQNVLLNKNVLRAAGFNVPDVHERRETNEQSYHLNFFELSWMPQDERRDYLQRKSTKRSRENRFDLLDISFSANPLRDLKLFSIEALKNIRMIDMSWSYLKANEIKQFFDYLQQINTQKLIVLVSRAQNAYEDILKAAWRIPHVYVHERNDAANMNEIPVFTPAQARRWGIYEQLPNTPLKRISLS
ncbi:MAG: hypothetical protein AB7V32_00310, partial [Candidatus Berkiella sp.]